MLMRRILLIFGLLDLFLVVTNADRVPSEIRYFANNPAVKSRSLFTHDDLAGRFGIWIHSLPRMGVHSQLSMR